ncbi:hypothetical protein [Streptomyces sp. NPDC001388]|uniref:hypothetical protein n=1 Tax=Streptomyces sp. NPDC001388 TaxID=3364568 RepID=UPI00367451E6
MHTHYVLAGQTPVLVHNSNGCMNWASNSVKTWGHTFKKGVPLARATARRPRFRKQQHRPAAAPPARSAERRTASHQAAAAKSRDRRRRAITGEATDRAAHPAAERPGRSRADAVTEGRGVVGAGAGLLEAHVAGDLSAHPPS